MGPNRVPDAEALGKPLGTLLERSWTLLEAKKNSGNRSWADMTLHGRPFFEKKKFRESLLSALIGP